MVQKELVKLVKSIDNDSDSKIKAKDKAIIGLGYAKGAFASIETFPIAYRNQKPLPNKLKADVFHKIDLLKCKYTSQSSHYYSVRRSKKS